MEVFREISEVGSHSIPCVELTSLAWYIWRHWPGISDVIGLVYLTSLAWYIWRHWSVYMWRQWLEGNLELRRKSFLISWNKRSGSKKKHGRSLAWEKLENYLSTVVSSSSKGPSNMHNGQLENCLVLVWVCLRDVLLLDQSTFMISLRYGQMLTADGYDDEVITMMHVYWHFYDVSYHTSR